MDELVFKSVNDKCAVRLFETDFVNIRSVPTDLPFPRYKIVCCY